MKILLYILLTPLTLLGQEVVFESPDEGNPYRSTEENIYYKNNKYEPFTPQPIEVVRRHGLNHIKLLTTGNNEKPEISEANLTKIKRDMTFLDPNNMTIGSENRSEIFKYANSKGTVAALFLDPKYDELMWGEPGYWIKLTDKNGSRVYYTGLAQNYYIKLLDTGNNIWKNDSTLQINAVRVRLIEPFIHPVRAPKYETIETLRIEITIADLRRDTDKDGLTDIEEDKLMLNPLSNDTDGDGVVDPDDPNPRFKSVTTNEALVYKAMLDNFINDTIKIRDGNIIDPKRPKLIHTSKPRTHLIVTDDVNLQRVDLDYDQFIIITKNEYQSFKVKYPVTPDEINVSPFFRVDGMPDVFVISTSTDLSGTKYVVKKVKNGFDIRKIEFWIH